MVRTSVPGFFSPGAGPVLKTLDHGHVASVGGGSVHYNQSVILIISPNIYEQLGFCDHFDEIRGLFIYV